MGPCRGWGCSAISTLLFNGFILHLQRDTGTPERVDEPGALFSPPHKVSTVAVTQNPLLGASSAYKIPVLPASLGNRHVVPEDANPDVWGSQDGGQRGSARGPISAVLH